MDFVLEFLFEMYLSLATIIVPDKKFKKWQEVLLKILCVLVSLIIVFCFIFGIEILAEANKQSLQTGIILTSVAGVLFVTQTVLFIFVIVKTLKKEKSQNKKDNNQDFD